MCIRDSRCPGLKIYVYASTDEILYKAPVDYPPLFSALKKGEYETIDISEGDILKIRADGLLERNTFSYSYYYGRNWWDYGSYADFGKSGYTRDDYIADLKSVATYQGYAPSDVDELISAGFSLDEIEDYMYYGGEI